MASSSMSTSSSSAKKRDQVLLACDRCRSKKTKCDGARPVCSSCFRRKVLCVYDAERDADATPITAVKRKLEQIQPQLTQHQELFALLKDSSDAGAQRVLSALRAGGDIESALQAARFQQSPDRSFPSVSAEKLSRPDVPRRSRTGLQDHDGETIRPVSVVAQGNIFERPSLRRVASHGAATKVKNAGRPTLVQRTLSVEHDSRIQAAHGRDWGVTYLDDESFRNIVRCFFTWDHPSFSLFDEELFLDQLAKGQPSELCTSLLVHSMMALASRNFYHVQPEKAAVAEHFGLAAATQQWDMSLGDATPAVIIAGMLLFLVYEFKGQDKFGWPYLAQAEQLARLLGLFRPAMAHRTFDPIPEHALRTRGRQAVAYGLFNYRAYLSLSHNLQPMTDRPAISMAVPKLTVEVWTAWPWPGACQQLTGQLQQVRSVLSLIVTDIMPLHHKYEASGVTKEHYDAALAIYQRLCKWYDNLDEPLKSLRVSSPQLIAIHNYQQLALLQLFGPFVLEPDGAKSFLPTRRLLQEAGLEVGSTVSAYLNALEELKTNVFHFDRQWSPWCTPPQNFAPLVHICLAALPRLKTDLDARYIFSLGLLLCLRIAKSFAIYRAILRSIRATAARKSVTLPSLAQRVFARLAHDYPVLPALDKVRSTFIVDARLRHTDVEASTLESLVRDMHELNVV